VLNIVGNLISVEFAANSEALEDEQIESAWWNLIAAIVQVRVPVDDGGHAHGSWSR
jgi:hypothetical protein